MLNITRKITLVLAVLALGLVPGAAFARHGGDDDGRKRVAGTCDGSATSKLKVKPDDGRLEAEFEVDQNRNGVTWKVRFRLNGVRVVKTNATTKAPSGSFSLERRLDNPAGTDKVAARAISPSGQVCKASLSI